MDVDRVIAEEIRKNDREYISPTGDKSSLEKYVLTVGYKDLLDTLRAVSMAELNEQVAVDNPPSQILVDGMSTTKRGIESAQRKVVMRFQDARNLAEAVQEIYDLLQKITRIQIPAMNDIVARNHFFLYLNKVNLGEMPMAISKIMYSGMVTSDSFVQVVGPLINYGRRLFWSPLGSTQGKMKFYRVASKRGGGVRFRPPPGSGPTFPRFRPWKLSMVKKRARRSGAATAALRSMLSGRTPPGRVENAGQIVKRLIQRSPKYKGLHFSDGWIEYGPAVGWSKLADPRVPAFGVAFSKKGKFNLG